MYLALSLFSLAVVLQIAAVIIGFSLFYQSAKIYRWGWLLLAISVFLSIIRDINPIFNIYESNHYHLRDAWFSLFISLFLLLGIIQIKKLLFQVENNLIALESIAQYDPLTHSLSRTEIMHRIYEEIDRSYRSKSSFALMEIDIDHFKAVNDRFGHEEGDTVLVGLVQDSKKNIRSIDSIGRIGGEEFLILLPNTKIQAAMQIAERLRSDIAQKTYQLKSCESVQITISIGITTFDPVQMTNYQRGDLLEELIRQADMAMYEAKNNGRNRVAIWHIEHTIMPK